MAHAFADGSVGLWIVNPANLSARLPAIAAYAGGMFSDVFVPRSALPMHMTMIRSYTRPNGVHLRAQLWTQPGGLAAEAYADQCLADIARLKPGVIEWDIEPSNDAALAPYTRAVHTRFRATRSGFLVRVNIAPYKGGYLPVDLFQSDPRLYVAEQTYYGDMSRVSEGEAILDLLEAGVPAAKAGLCYGAAGPGGINPQRFCTLPTLYYQQQLVRPLHRGVVFQDDLMVSMGLL